MRDTAFLIVALAAGVLPGTVSQAPATRTTAADAHARAVELHNARRLDEASRDYARTLALDPARDPSRDELAIITRFAPRVYTVESEFFPLRDFAAVLHPSARLIAYHLFWDDDIDFPDDNDPCDHEVVWVQYSSDGRSLERFWTYFHGRILDGGDAALDDARANRGRPRVNVQWGKHGSMPAGWETLSIVANEGDIERSFLSVGKPATLVEYNRAAWEKLHREGRRLPNHPLARRLGWPEKFGGDWTQFTAFTRLVDPIPLLDRHGMTSVSRWNSAVINQHFLTYNFRPKTEWPVDAAASASAVSNNALFGTAALDTFQLPPKLVFDRAMPRYPNVWFYVDAALAPNYAEAVRIIADQTRGPMRFKESYGPFSNPEGCDFEVTLEHLQPWDGDGDRSNQHAHAFHMRYYYSALARAGLDRITLATSDGPRSFYRFAASAHYEVEHHNPNHADVEGCPICGRTGEYAALSGNLVERVHDPLGVELLLDGTIRGQVVRFDNDQQEVAGLQSVRDRLRIEPHVFSTSHAEHNTLRVGVVVVTSVHEAK